MKILLLTVLCFYAYFPTLTWSVVIDVLLAKRRLADVPGHVLLFLLDFVVAHCDLWGSNFDLDLLVIVAILHLIVILSHLIDTRDHSSTDRCPRLSFQSWCHGHIRISGTRKSDNLLAGRGSIWHECLSTGCDRRSVHSCWHLVLHCWVTSVGPIGLSLVVSCCQVLWPLIRRVHHVVVSTMPRSTWHKLVLHLRQSTCSKILITFIHPESSRILAGQSKLSLIISAIRCLRGCIYATLLDALPQVWSPILSLVHWHLRLVQCLVLLFDIAETVCIKQERRMVHLLLHQAQWWVAWLADVITIGWSGARPT